MSYPEWTWGELILLFRKATVKESISQFRDQIWKLGNYLKYKWLIPRHANGLRKIPGEYITKLGKGVKRLFLYTWVLFGNWLYHRKSPRKVRISHHKCEPGWIGGSPKHTSIPLTVPSARVLCRYIWVGEISIQYGRISGTTPCHSLRLQVIFCSKLSNPLLPPNLYQFFHVLVSFHMRGL